MKINNVINVFKMFVPNCKRPSNGIFTFLGEEFSICTYRAMRGPYELQGDETPEGYFVDCYSKWIDFHVDVYPERGEYKIRSGLNKRGIKHATDEELSEYRRKADEIKNAFVNAIVLKTNADRIRSMSDEELASFITSDLCELLCGSPLSCDGDCGKKMLDWLRQVDKQTE